MKIGELHKDRESEQYPSPEVIVTRQIAAARASYLQHGDKYDDITLLAFVAFTLAKNLTERTVERDRLRKLANDQAIIIDKMRINHDIHKKD